MIAGLPLARARSKAGREILGLLHRLAMAAIGAGKGCEIRIGQIRAADAAGIFPLLMHADGAVDAVVDDERDDRQVVAHGGREFLAVHQEAAVAGKADHLALGKEPLGGNGSRQAIAHRAGRRRGLRVEAAEAMEAVQPGGVVAGAVGEDRIGCSVLASIQSMIGPICTAPGPVCGGFDQER